MARKSYSEQEREDVKKGLLAAGLRLFSERGFKSVRLMDICKEVGISKPFFYSFYESMEELVVKILDYQQEILYQMVREEMAREEVPVEHRMRSFLLKAINNRENHLFIMTQEEEVWVYRHLTRDHFEAFQRGQIVFYRQILSLWGVPEERCGPELLGNLILSILLIHNSAERSLPFFFTGRLDETAERQIDILAQYLAGLRR